MKNRKIKTFSGFVLLILCFSLNATAQRFTLESIFNTPFIYGVTASSKTADIVFTSVDKGARNVFLAKYPYYQTKKLTNFNQDEGQEITSLSITADGMWAVFVRGGDHGGNATPRPINPSSSIVTPTIGVYSINLKTNQVKSLGDGDYPMVNNITKKVVFLASGDLVIAPLDGSIKPVKLFADLGSPRAYKWSPDGKKLLFTSRRDNRSFVGVYEEGKNHIKWISPSYFKDEHGTWSPDGKKIAFIRTQSAGMAPDSAGVRPISSWRILVHSLETETLDTVYVSPLDKRSATPLWAGSYNLAWTNQHKLTFLSYTDGWPHLYAVDLASKNVKQLTKGNFTVDNLNYSSDGNLVAYAANYGENPEDIDRKQLGVVNVNTGAIKYLTTGDQIASSPTFINNNKNIVFLSGTAKRPGTPAIVAVDGNMASAKLIGSELLAKFKYDDLIIPEHVRFKSLDGVEVYGQLFKPKNGKEKTAGIVYVHGGPRRQMLLGWHFMDYYFYDYALNQYLANQGFTVLAINYRSGTGYGYDFQTAAHAGRLGASEYQDIKAAGLWLQKQSTVDSARIGIYGGSHGGFLTAMALAKDSDLFKVGVDIHGVHTRVSGGGTEKGGTKDLVALHSSPSYWINGWKSPGLIIHGDDDFNVEFNQSVDLANRLINRKLPVEFLVIPNETHHWMVFQNLLKVKEETFKFLAKHLQ